jgi:hypothetical protein
VTSCTGESGNKITGGNLSVYFDDASDKEVAKKIAVFWKDHKLLTGKEQDIKLIRSGEVHQLYLIAVDEKEAVNLSFRELKALTELQNLINEDSLSSMPIEIVVCDDQFKPLMNINK